VMMAARGAADLVRGAEVIAAVERRVVVGVGREAAVRRRRVGSLWGAEREGSVVGGIEAVVRRRWGLVVGREVLNRVGVIVIPGPRGGSAAAGKVRVGVVVAGVGAPVVRVVERRVRIHEASID
jgi:hypothetical protein